MTQGEIYPVLHRLKFPGQIGAAARAAKNFGLQKVRLVEPPPHFHLASAGAAHGALDILDTASVYSQLRFALADCTLALRIGVADDYSSSKLITPKEAARVIARLRKNANVALVFTDRDVKLNADEMSLCDYNVVLPFVDNPYPLQVAQALLIMGYELYLVNHEVPPNRLKVRADDEQTSRLGNRLNLLLKTIGIHDNVTAEHYLNRAVLYDYEVNAFLGIVKKILLHLGCSSP